MMDIRTAKALALKGAEHMVRHRQWKGNMPEALAPWHVYLLDSGHSVLAIPECRAGDVPSPDQRWQWLAAAPLPAVIAHGYRVDDDGYIYTGLPYGVTGFSSEGADYGDHDDPYDDTWLTGDLDDEPDEAELCDD